MSRKGSRFWSLEVGEELALIHSEISHSTPLVAKGRHWEPRLDLATGNDTVIVTVELAGVNAEDISLTYDPHENSLMLTGKRVPANNQEDSPHWHQLEIYYGEFSRLILLPPLALDVEKSQIHFKHGMLSITIPINRTQGENFGG